MYAWFYLAEKLFAMIAAKEAVGRRRTCPVHLHIHHFCACFWRRLLLPIGSLGRPRSVGQIPSGTYTVRIEVGLFHNDQHRVKKAKPKCDYTSDPKAAKCKKKEVTKSKRARIQFDRCQNKEHYAKPYSAVKKMPSAKRDLNRKCGKEEEVRVREGPWPRLEVAITFGWDRLRAKRASQEVTITNLSARMKGITENPERKSLFSSSFPFVQLNLRFRSLTKSTALLTNCWCDWIREGRGESREGWEHPFFKRDIFPWQQKKWENSDDEVTWGRWGASSPKSSP